MDSLPKFTIWPRVGRGQFKLNSHCVKFSGNMPLDSNANYRLVWSFNHVSLVACLLSTIQANNGFFQCNNAIIVLLNNFSYD